MIRKIALLPVDARPVTRELPCQLAKIGGWEVLVPGVETLGFLKKPADIDSLQKWLVDVAPEVDGIVLSTDMLGYGGLVPSRISVDSEEIIQQRLTIIKRIKANDPEKKIMLFSATMRISNNNVNEEEKEYWKDYGELIWAYSYNKHKFEKTGLEEARMKRDEAELKIPSDILEDYIQTRERNFAISTSLLDLLEQGIVDTIVYPQDDTAEYGLNISEQEQLASLVHERGLRDKVYIYPGADEVGAALVTKMIFQLEGLKPPVFFPFYSGERGALSSAMYEDRPICESVKGQIHVIGGYTIDNSLEADIVLAVNVPGKRQGDLALQKFLEEVNTPDRNVGEWLRRVRHYIEKGKQLAIADLAYANGADENMLPDLLASSLFSRISGFGAWNTAGNTLGTVVAQASMIYLQQEKMATSEEDSERALFEQLCVRLLDDYLYQSHVRQMIRKEIAEVELTSHELLDIATRHFHEQVEKFHSVLDFHPKWEMILEEVYLPWDRTFEIGVKLSSKRKVQVNV
ncbi:hypothetical protein JOC85_002562 [Bacillus mesophilus]|uniref:DUF4127 family protein n=1 Tax=Bacillus mesophilus TaxID=1808955 RepID=A0A6M0Q817_9BACI|nr:DUF4127 family protein [Bacillus mesophilus]MBM7661759.1 hypothetical protein [Bacillus mesophilus]NEY72417.1 DUF4127 family protein [Bacillus mesophilus]